MKDSLNKSRIFILNANIIASNINELIKIDPLWIKNIILSDNFTIDKEENVWRMCLNYRKNVNLHLFINNINNNKNTNNYSNKTLKSLFILLKILNQVIY